MGDSDAGRDLELIHESGMGFNYRKAWFVLELSRKKYHFWVNKEVGFPFYKNLL